MIKYAASYKYNNRSHSMHIFAANWEAAKRICDANGWCLKGALRTPAQIRDRVGLPAHVNRRQKREDACAEIAAAA